MARFKELGRQTAARIVVHTGFLVLALLVFRWDGPALFLIYFYQVSRILLSGHDRAVQIQRTAIQ